MQRILIALLLTIIIILPGCLDQEKSAEQITIPNLNNAIDITNAVFTKTDSTCESYIGEYSAKVTDKSNNNQFESAIIIEMKNNNLSNKCTITSNGIPNHDFAINGSFATKTDYVNEIFNVPNSQNVADDVMPLSLQYDNAIFLNGVKLDLLAAACYGVGPDSLGNEKIGCFNSDIPWRYDPMHPSNNFGEDDNHAHTQPDGAYHYHGDPRSMYDLTGTIESGVIGFAADGFPIRGPYIDDNGTIREISSSYVLKEGERTSQEGEGEFPGGNWDGTFRDDYVWQEGAGDLDSCNGKWENGTYYYYVTFSFPWVMNCFVGTPDDSFKK